MHLKPISRELRRQLFGRWAHTSVITYDHSNHHRNIITYNALNFRRRRGTARSFRSRSRSVSPRPRSRSRDRSPDRRRHRDKKRSKSRDRDRRKWFRDGPVVLQNFWIKKSIFNEQILTLTTLLLLKYDSLKILLHSSVETVIFHPFFSNYFLIRCPTSYPCRIYVLNKYATCIKASTCTLLFK